MIHSFSEETIQVIEKILGVKPKKNENLFRFEIQDEKKQRKIALEIHIGLRVEGKPINLVSVYAHDIFLQLHNCTAFAASEVLNQITFFGKEKNKTSGLIIEKEAGCSLYANVNESLLQGDFTQFPPEVMMCSVALSLTESPDIEGFQFEED